MCNINPLEISYIEHILVALRVKDASAPYRTFFDNWFAFRVGGPFLNRNSRPHWFNAPSPDRHGEALRRADFISAAAARTLSQLTRDRLVKDHAIPVSVLRDMLFETQPQTQEDVREFLRVHYRIGIITATEHAALSAAGLTSRMPSGWRTKGDSLFLRYENAGIVAQDLSRDGGKGR